MMEAAAAAAVLAAGAPSLGLIWDSGVAKIVLHVCKEAGEDPELCKVGCPRERQFAEPGPDPKKSRFQY